LSLRESKTQRDEPYDRYETRLHHLALEADATADGVQRVFAVNVPAERTAGERRGGLARHCASDRLDD